MSYYEAWQSALKQRDDMAGIIASERASNEALQLQLNACNRMLAAARADVAALQDAKPQPEPWRPLVDAIGLLVHQWRTDGNTATLPRTRIAEAWDAYIKGRTAAHPDWTCGADGRSNSSAGYLRLCAEVERLIRSDAHALIDGRAEHTARLIMSELAHEQGLRPA